MRTIDRYLRRVLFVHFTIALLTLLAIFSVVNLAEELQSVGTGSYTIGHALRFVALTLPAEAYELFAATALLGGVTGLGSLTAHNEILALWAAGVSPGRLVLLVVRSAAWLALGAVLLGEVVVPPLTRDAYVERSVRRSDGAALNTVNGLWIREGERFINVRTPTPGETMRDLYLYELDGDGRLRRFAYAERVSYEGSRWTLEAVTEHELSEEGSSVRHLAARTLESFPAPRQLQTFLLPPESLSSMEVYASIRSLARRGESTSRYELALWQRLVTPLAAIIMVFLSVPFVVGASGGAAMGRRIATGALLGIGYQMASQTLARAGLVYGLSPALTTFLPPLLALIAGWSLLRRV